MGCLNNISLGVCQEALSGHSILSPYNFYTNPYITKWAYIIITYIHYFLHFKYHLVVTMESILGFKRGCPGQRILFNNKTKLFKHPFFNSVVTKLNCRTISKLWAHKFYMKTLFLSFFNSDIEVKKLLEN